MPQKFDVAVIGAGMVGLATAYQLKNLHPRLAIIVIEKEKEPAKHQSGRNSGVIHTGVYYKPGSLKATNCIAGREELLRFCQEHSIPYKLMPKVIVATKQQQIARLEEIFQRGQANGVPGLEMIDRAKLKEIEPYAEGVRALSVPGSAVIHFPDVARGLARWLEEQGSRLVFDEEVLTLKEGVIETSKRTYETKAVVNCAGLYSDKIARLSLGDGKVLSRIIPFRGEYYQIKSEKAHLVRGLIYPVPDPKFPFLGVHLTRMIDGSVEAGPNAVMAFAREGYRKRDVKLAELAQTLGYLGFWKMALRYWNVGLYEMYRSLSKKAFVKDLQELIPSICEDDLVPGGSGVRAQLVTPEGKMADDFSLMKEGNTVHVLNAPSPAATASFAIGRQIAHELSGGMAIQS